MSAYPSTLVWVAKAGMPASKAVAPSAARVDARPRAAWKVETSMDTKKKAQDRLRPFKHELPSHKGQQSLIEGHHHGVRVDAVVLAGDKQVRSHGTPMIENQRFGGPDLVAIAGTSSNRVLDDKLDRQYPGYAKYCERQQIFPFNSTAHC
jgi:hypothetical protein